MGLLVQCPCPVCFKKVYLGNCKIVSGKTRTVDPLTGVDEGEVLKKPLKPFAAVRVPPLDGPTYTLNLARRQCTNINCKYELPYNIENVPSLTLTIVGDTFSGKTHYIAALIHQVRVDWQQNAMGPGMVRIECLTPELEATYLKNFNTPNAPHIPANPPGQKGTYPKPLIYKVTSSSNARRPATEFNLLIYDLAGEDFYTANLVHFGQFVLKTNAFIFVADPFAIPTITNSLSGQLQSDLKNMIDYAQQRRLADGLNDTIQILKRYRRIPSNAKLRDLPIAIMLSKSDLLGQLQVSSPPNYTFLRPPTQYYSHLDLKDVGNVHKEVADLLAFCGQNDLLNAAKGFDLISFFATSATGKPPIPGTQNKFQGPSPKRCLDPFLWIMYQLGVIEGR